METVADIGGGTDYVAFLDHLGIPSTDFTFEGPHGVYHSAFDNHRCDEDGFKFPTEWVRRHDQH